ncbi:hypothetical protein QIU18_08215 [Capnocytophaga canimorsus]|nr:hypothetical protein [Capnocytophaga canimorsus]WGU69662.1 hypothetical protein QIU18_08215 [Capnocytophaga canimorsus]
MRANLRPFFIFEQIFQEKHLKIPRCTKKGFFSLQPDQRKGVFALLVLIVVVQCIYFWVDFQKMPQSESAEFVTLKKQLDSLKKS